MKSSWLTQLRCPHHPNGEALESSGGDALQCRECGRRYPIRDGIIDLLDEADLAAFGLQAEAEQWDRQADQYDVRERDPQYMAGAEAVARSLDAQPGETILDVGCGTGITLRAWYQPGVKVVAVDLSLQSLRNLRRRLPDADLLLIRGDASRLPFAPGVFDKAVCANTIQQIPQSEGRERCVVELSRVVRKGGRVVVSAHQFAKWKREKGWLKEGAVGSHTGPVQYIYRYQRDEFHQLMSRGLRVERIGEAGFRLPYRFKLSPISRWIERRRQRSTKPQDAGHMLVGVGVVE